MQETIANTTAGNELSPNFVSAIESVRENFFSRDPEKWPIFNDPGIRQLHDFRRKHIEMRQAVANYPNGSELHEQLGDLNSIPASSTVPNGEIDPLLLFATSMSKNWEDPAAVENVVCMPSDPAIYGSVIGTVANPNLAYKEYSEMADEMEKAVVRQFADLVGYDAEKATGVFTQGGTFCNMYGYLFGLRKSMPESITNGLANSKDYRVINSQGGHYSNTTNLSVLGVDHENKTIRIKVNENNDIDLVDLERQLEACFRLKCVVPTIMLTMGTTDTFGVDQVKPVYDIIERLCDFFEVEVKPHIHVDAAVGWPMVFFLDYDFTVNPLDINEVTLAGLERNVERFQQLKFADSFTVDFQKWGFVPYTSSLVMVKNKADMLALEHDPENFSYFEKDVQGQNHLQSTIECSRGASGMFGAYTGMKYLGKEGYQILISHGLQNASYMRERLSEVPGAKILAPDNMGPSVAFRLYDPAKVKDVDAEYAYEKAYEQSEEYQSRVDANTAYHRKLFLNRGKRNLYTNWVEFIASTSCGLKGKWGKLPGEKAVFMNPLTDRKQIDGFISNILKQ